MWLLLNLEMLNYFLSYGLFVTGTWELWSLIHKQQSLNLIYKFNYQQFGAVFNE
jgi:hypothetical protein